MEIAIKKNGFTLIELIIVVAVLGVIAAIAIPSYQKYVQKTKRVEVQAELSEIANKMQRFKMANYTFAESVSGNTVTPIGLKRLGYLSNTPKSQNGTYEFNLTFSADAKNWVLSAVPTSGSQNGTGVSCINELGQRYWAQTVSTAASCASYISSTSNWDGK